MRIGTMIILNRRVRDFLAGRIGVVESYPTPGAGETAVRLSASMKPVLIPTDALLAVDAFNFTGNATHDLPTLNSYVETDGICADANRLVLNQDGTVSVQFRKSDDADQKWYPVSLDANFDDDEGHKQLAAAIDYASNTVSDDDAPATITEVNTSTDDDDAAASVATITDAVTDDGSQAVTASVTTPDGSIVNITVNINVTKA